MNRAVSLCISLALAYVTALIGSFFTFDAIDTWYATLVKPPLNPPNWIFGPVWTALYTLMAVAAWRVYVRRTSDHTARSSLWIYAAHLVVNAAWSVTFFGLQDPTLALFVIALLWGLIAYLSVRFYRIDKLAGYLFVPYLAWVSFASYLNLAIVVLN